jgi:hypothetical protein
MAPPHWRAGPLHGPPRRAGGAPGPRRGLRLHASRWRTRRGVAWRGGVSGGATVTMAGSRPMHAPASAEPPIFPHTPRARLCLNASALGALPGAACTEQRRGRRSCRGGGTVGRQLRTECKRLPADRGCGARGYWRRKKHLRVQGSALQVTHRQHAVGFAAAITAGNHHPPPPAVVGGGKQGQGPNRRLRGQQLAARKQCGRVHKTGSIMHR